MAYLLYSCEFLDDHAHSPAIVELDCGDDSDAILAGRYLAESRPGCNGYEIRFGDRLVYRHERSQLQLLEQSRGGAAIGHWSASAHNARASLCEWPLD